jgi:hypothetical protein
MAQNQSKTMAKSTLQDYEFLQCEDGIYFGRALKNGSVSKDARKITNEEIIYMFSELLQDYCLRNNKPLILEKNGKPFIQAQIII